MTTLEKYIESEGAILSGKLSEYIVENYKVEEATARKRIERLKSPIHKLRGFFSERQSLIYHANSFNSDVYFQKLKDAFEIAAKRYYAVIKAIDYHHGLILKEDLPNYTFSPHIKIKGHLLYSTLIEKLVRIGVLLDYDDLHYQLNKYLTNDIEPNYRYYKAVQFSKDLLINQFGNWGRNIGLVSFNKGEQNSNVGGFQFAYTAPSYLSGLVQYKNSIPKPGFVVADILFGNSTQLQDVNFFIQKIHAIRASNPTLRILPVLIVESVEVTALNKLKQAGALIATIRELFGANYNELLKELINTITNAGAILKRDPEKYINLMSQLTKLVEGKTNNLRGDLFELAVGYYYGQYCKSLDVGKKIWVEGEYKTLEIDVLAIYENEVKIIECKGYKYPVDEDYIFPYLNDKIPAIRKWVEKGFGNRKQTFEIWSTGGFTNPAENLLEKAKINTKKYTIDYLNKEKILKRAKDLQTRKFSDILREYYFKDII